RSSMETVRRTTRNLVVITMSLVVLLGASRQARASDDGSVIDLMVVYTPETRTESGGTDAIESHIVTWIGEVNNLLENSGALFRYRVVHTGEVVYNSSDTTHVTVLDHLHDVDGVA